MADADISQTTITNISEEIDTFQIPFESTDGAEDQKETEYTIEHWNEYLGYYKTVAQIRIAIDAKSIWTIGKGFVTDPITEMQLGTFTGFGKDTFNTILEDLHRTMQIAGDSFAEIILDDDIVINLKPLDPSTITIVADSRGIIKEYRQKSKINSKGMKVFKPEQILHLSRNRVADEIHGISVIEAVKDIIDARQEAFIQHRKILRKYAEPTIIWKVDTDNTTKRNAFKEEVEEARKKGENLIIPETTVEHEVLTIAPNATLSPATWIEQLDRYFYQTIGVPAIIVGNSQSLTEAASKMEHLVWEQKIREEQLYLEEQILNQLNMEIKLEFPVSLQNELLSGKAKGQEAIEEQQIEGIEINPPKIENQQGLEPNDATAELEGRR